MRSPAPRCNGALRVAALAAALLAGLSPAALLAQTPVPADDESLLDGAAAFTLYCTECHGWDPSEQYTSLYGDDPVSGAPDVIAELRAEEAAAAAVDEEFEDWPEWAGPPPDVDAEEVDMRASILGDLTGAIDDIYVDDTGFYDWQREADTPEAIVLDDLGDNFDDSLSRAPGATDLTNPDTYMYGTTELDLFFNIANGTGATMAGFIDQLGGEEGVWDVVNYIRSLWPEDLVE